MVVTPRSKSAHYVITRSHRERRSIDRPRCEVLGYDGLTSRWLFGSLGGLVGGATPTAGGLDEGNEKRFKACALQALLGREVIGIALQVDPVGKERLANAGAGHFGARQDERADDVFRQDEPGCSGQYLGVLGDSPAG